ncbi:MULTISPECIES: rhomboid family intramembrane serine protease [Gammaproteobacteria]|uniref:rhomboid family intramembrane serine protease n=1 Tax=Gammaproteobacteria TaxID=1236 RepID=UPI000DD034C3|nr:MULTISPECIES: rhomboid family intramembrane serine protease [Gammaproteobacteria]RTE86468.1 rhomboid family intramembrane serine protease [Aliidiomarina sp. B3213]TCZ90977.1 rhomboid family intramembrane serine protease [Lysobacter sp. N42]
MKKLTQSSDETHIKKLYALLLQHRIPVHVTEEQGKVVLWLLQPAFEAQALELIAQFHDNPDQFQFKQGGKSQSGLALLWHNMAAQAGIVTFVIAIAVLAVAALQFLFFDSTTQSLLIAPPNATEFNWQQPWKLVTPAFLHFSATHLIFNVFWWWYLGGRIELTQGKGTLITLFFLTAVISNFVQFAVSGPLFGGLSGVVYGLLGFCMIMSAKRGGPLWLPPALIFFMVLWLVLGYSNALWVNMANEAHLSGLLSGLGLGAYYRFVLKR